MTRRPDSRRFLSSSLPSLSLLALLAQLAAFGVSSTAHAQAGFQLNRYEPTAPGEWFLAVERPWYSATRYFAAGITLDYGHDPLVVGRLSPTGAFQQTDAIIAHQLVGHVDLAVAFLDRIQVSATLPVTLYESGKAEDGTGPTGVVVGDPRVGVMVRLWNQAEKNAFSLHAGVHVWIPIGQDKNLAGDSTVRVLPKIVLAGLAVDHLRWSFTAAYEYRASNQIGSSSVAAGSSVGQELQFAAALGYTDHARRFNIGPEVNVYTTLSDFFAAKYTGIELLGSFQYSIAMTPTQHLMVGAGLGTGIARAPGTPDLRALLRIAYAPVRDVDTDGDGINDPDDACPLEKGPKTNDRHTNGCPDRDHDDVIDRDDLCPDVPRGDRPDPARAGCPAADRDHDGVPDADDKCPDVPAGTHPDPARPGCPNDADKDGVIDADDICPDQAPGEYPDPDRKGCPLPDRDHDGVPDAMDSCPDVAAGAHPDPERGGCPRDTDQDGVIDDLDQCPTVPAGIHPDPARPGCPLPDRDNDGIPDSEDACPDKVGAPNPDPKKNGCPGLVMMKNGMIVILSPVFFATDKDAILPKSNGVLTAVANAFIATPSIKRAAVEGHTDSKGDLAHNTDLSERRAKSVVAWLVAHGVAADRLEAHGYGPLRPIADNKTNSGRAANRRVEFHIVDPAPPLTPAAAAPTDAPPPDAPPPAHGKPHPAAAPRRHYSPRLP